MIQCRQRQSKDEKGKRSGGKTARNVTGSSKELESTYWGKVQVKRKQRKELYTLWLSTVGLKWKTVGNCKEIRDYRYLPVAQGKLGFREDC
jgi:hypothetical protein